MKLRCVEMVGFKSFRDRVSVELSDGMTCIVGPNGCGKSNVVDAIKWAMGDMSPKSLRGNSLRDVIFAGTEKEKPAGMAEVTLTFENTAVTEGNDAGGDSQGDDDHSDDESLADSVEGEPDWELGDSIPRKFQNLAEIAITRRLHRSGESEYLINKVQCRLRDIRDLLAGTGLGKQGYSIIEQGQIGFVVNARPSERRLIIEEASGITRYKDRRKRAARKLERSEQNLHRTRDLCDEIEKKVKVLADQAEKAREHRALSEELEGLEISLLLQRRNQAAKATQTHKRKLADAKKTMEARAEKLEITEENLEKARSQAKQADQRHADLTENYYELETRLNLAKSNREHTREARDDASRRIEELQEEQARQRERKAHFGDEIARTRRQLRTVEQKPDQSQDVVDKLQQELDELKASRRKRVERRDELRRRIEGRRAAVRRISDRLEWIDDQFQELDEREVSVTRQLEDANETRRDLERRINRLTLDLEQINDAIEECRQGVERSRSKHKRALEEVGEISRREEQLARRKLELQTQIESLEAMRRQGQGYDEGVRRVMEWARTQNRDDVFGPVGRFLQVPEGQEAAYAAFFGDRLHDIVVADRQAALAAIEVLSDEEVGRIGCRPLPEGVTEPGRLVALWPDEIRVVDDLSDVSERADDDGDVRGWATVDGDVIFDDGRIVGGGTGDRTETVLRQTRQLEKLNDEFADVDAEYRDVVEKLELVREDAAFVEERLEARKTELEDMEHKARTLEQQLDGERRERDRADERMERLETRLEEFGERRRTLGDEQAELAERRETIVDELPDDEKRLVKAEADVEALDGQLEKKNQALTDHKVKRAQVDERRRHLRENIEHFQESIDDAVEQIERIVAEIEEQTVRRDEARMRVETLDKEVKRLADDHDQLGTEVEEAKTLTEKVSERVESVELSVLAQRQDLEEAKEEVQSRQMAMQKARLNIEHVTEQLAERFEMTLDQARKRAMEVETPVDDRQERAKTIKKRLGQIGEVNPLAIEEFEEAKERFEFHSQQQRDLEESVADLRDAIERMDRESRRRFRETFEAVDEKFKEVFPRLFQGGKAQLILTEPDDLLETGVDIEVQPPGKKLQNVSLLSGGEKALTAVSLIFSIFLLKPSPFAVLDEVDAPLDDANVDRFAEMVKELSEISQMIVITHNRRTMEAPERLYGVTMEEAGISKVVSVELTDVDGRLAS